MDYSQYIVDHAHDPNRVGTFVLSTCAVCGNPCGKHWSYGVFMASKLGGVPTDYLDSRND